MNKQYPAFVRRSPATLNKVVPQEGKELPKFIPLLCALQVGLHYWKMEDVDLLLGSDPLKRAEIWRFLTVCFKHQRDGHLWSSLIPQLLFGLPLESALKWKSTGVIYFTSVLFASLLNTSLQPCSKTFAGASDACSGLAVACVLGYLVNRKSINGFTTFIAVESLLESCVFPLLPRAITAYFPLDFGNFNSLAPLGGALGGFISGVLVWYCYLYSCQRRGWVIKLRWAVVILALLFVLATVGMNIHYTVSLNKVNERFFYRHVNGDPIVVLDQKYGGKSPDELCTILWKNRF